MWYELTGGCCVALNYICVTRTTCKCFKYPMRCTLARILWHQCSPSMNGCQPKGLRWTLTVAHAGLVVQCCPCGRDTMQDLVSMVVKVAASG
jgi:hypothetical protein